MHLLDGSLHPLIDLPLAHGQWLSFPCCCSILTHSECTDRGRGESTTICRSDCTNCSGPANKRDSLGLFARNYVVGDPVCNGSERFRSE